MKLFKKLLVLLLIFPIFVANGNELSLLKLSKSKTIVGLVSTQTPTYPNQKKTADRIAELFEEMGSKVFILDYNEIINKSLKEKISPKEIISNVLANHGISRILIPGNYYNISSEPLPLDNHRELVVNAIVQTIKTNHNIRLLALCGGLQDVMHVEGIEITRVDSMLKDHHSIGSHTISYPEPYSAKANLHKIIINKDSILGEVLKKYAHNSFENGSNWFQVYFPDAHSEAISNNYKNIAKLTALGYKINALSEDGIIEGVEDEYGNLYLQYHPEYMAMYSDEKYEKSKLKEKDMSILGAFAILNYFLKS